MGELSRNERRHKSRSLIFGSLVAAFCLLLVPFQLLAQEQTTTAADSRGTVTLLNSMPSDISAYYTAQNLAAALPANTGDITVTLKLSPYDSIIVRAEMGRYDAAENGLQLLPPGKVSSEYAISVESIPPLVTALSMWAQGTSPHTAVPGDVASALSNHNVDVVCRFTNSRDQWLDFVLYQNTAWPPRFHFRSAVFVGDKGTNGKTVNSKAEEQSNGGETWPHTKYFYLDSAGNGATETVVNFFAP